MKRLVLVMTATAVGVAGTTVGAPGGGGAAASAATGGVVWGECEGLLAGRADCARIPVPLDHRRPDGRKIFIGISRYRHTDTDDYQGVLFISPGGPSASGLLNSLAMANWLSGRGHGDVAAKYDMIGFDPRGVRSTDFDPYGTGGGSGPVGGGTEPVLSCDPDHKKPVLPDYVPASAAEERAWIDRSKRYAAECWKKFGWLLPHMSTVDHAHDVDAVREALGVEKISWYGFSHGTHFGATYATLFPQRVRRMVWDGNVDPRKPGYAGMLEQSRAFERNIGFWYRWAAKYDSIYKLGRTAEAVEKTYHRVRAEAARSPIGGRIGPSELDDIVLNTGLSTSVYIPYTQALSDWVTKKDAQPLLDNMDPGGDDSPFAVHNATMAADGGWPRDWRTWHRDATRLHERGYRSIAWSNVWHHAPIAFWPCSSGERPRNGGQAVLAPLELRCGHLTSRGGPALELRDRGLPGFLLAHTTLDGAMPVEGAYAMHRRFPSSRLMLELGGRSHANTLNGNQCVDDVIAAYLGHGRLPASRPGADVVCETDPAFNDPDPTVPQEPAGRSLPAGGS